jgi:hypothetical protein
MGSLSEQIEVLIRKNYGFGFTHWLASGAALKEFIEVYNSLGGKGPAIDRCNAQNLALALGAYEHYNGDLFVKDYIVFVQHIIEGQN